MVTRAVRHGDRASVLVVRMQSRVDRGITAGERMRSNRLAMGRMTKDTCAPSADKVIHALTVPEEGPYKHPGGMQIASGVVAIPLEQKTRTGDAETQIYFMDLSELPARPRPLPYSIEGDDKAGCVAFTKLGDEQYLLAFAGGDGKKIRFYKSNVTNLDDLDEDKNKNGFFLYDVLEHPNISSSWEVQEDKLQRDSTPQTINFMRQVDQDGKERLFTAAFYNEHNWSPSTVGRDMELSVTNRPAGLFRGLFKIRWQTIPLTRYIS